MKGKPNDDKTQANQDAAQGGAQVEPEGDGTIDYAAEIAQRDAQITEANDRIAELEACFEAATGANEELSERVEELRAENDQLKQQAETDRVNFALALAGCRNVKAARAVLDDYNGAIEALKSAEPWLFAAHAEATGATGLPNAGTAKDDGRDEKRWRRLAGLSAKKGE